LAAPLDRVRLRSSIEGVLREAQFVHRDCELDDVAMARLLAPRPLLYSYSTEDPSVQRFAGYISSPVIASIRSLYSSVGARNAFGLMADTAWTADARRRLRTWVDGALQFIPRDVPAHVNIEQPPSQAAYRVGWMDSVRAHRQDYSVRLGTCLADRRKVNTSSIPSFLRSVEPLRREVAERLGVPVSASPGRTTVIQKTLIAKRNGYSLYFVQLRSTRTPILISGLLAIPQFLPSGGVPAVVSADGDAGLAAPFGLVPTQGQPYLNAYADRLAASGTVVFVAYYPFDFPEIAAAEVAARRVSNQSSFGYLIPVFSGVVDYLVSLPGVDKSRLGIWGISFGGAAALYAGAIDTRFSSVVFSDPVVTADVLYSDRTSASLATWWPEICSTVDAVQAYLIAPRRLVRENGLRDNNGYERTPLESITRIRDVYASLGIESNFSFVRHSGGHETRPSDVDLFPSQ
ncbi:MAG TPA: prolyl oligopeptidase family serine peptidase, partial [Gemmatimonadaceae bacterium]|nr:prolyl oligopeptidase family serine peptidase [Gemmatimonadaceae bacterium]